MSHDLDVWSVLDSVSVESLPRAKKWRRTDDGWVLESMRWQIVITGPLEVEPEDMPDGVYEQLPGIKYQYQLNLEPIGAPWWAYWLVYRTARALAKSCHGLIFDPQNDSITMASGVTQKVESSSIGTDERFPIIEMAWWFQTPVFSTLEGTRAFVEVLRTHMPETLPSRYGSYEPPQFKLEKKGLDHFVSFLHANAGEYVVWYPGKHCFGVSISYVTAPDVYRPNDFRSHRLSIEFEAHVMDRPGGPEALRRLWHAMSALLQAFYGDVRTLDGRMKGGWVLMSDPLHEPHPIQSWFWRGLPETLGHAMVLGEPYTALWPEAVAAGTSEANLSFLDAGDWRKPHSIGLAAPTTLTQRVESTGPDKGTTDLQFYSATWPFEPGG